ncbi:MAG: FTR1 family protein [Candidatus Binatia bacterium]
MLLLPAAATAAIEGPGAQDVRRALTLLNVAAEEYREGVVDGRVVNELEYAEARAFLDEAESRLRSAAPDATANATAFAAARALIAEKQPAAQVREQLAALSAAISASTGVSEPVWPPAPPSASRGRALFSESCAACHGERGDGRGPTASMLVPPPANFADPAFMQNETPFDFFHVITLGRSRSAMPAWGDVLSLQERWDLVSFLWTVHGAPANWSEGQGVYLSACAGCHGSAGAGDGAYREVLRSPMRALNDPATLARTTDAELYALVADGRPGTAMPGFAGRLSEAQMRSAVAYARLLSLGGDDGARALAADEGAVVRYTGLLRLLADEYGAAVPAGGTPDPQGLIESEVLLGQVTAQAPRVQSALAARDAAAGRELETAVQQLARLIQARGPGREVSAAAARGAALLEAQFPAAAAAPVSSPDALAETSRMLEQALAAYRAGNQRAVYIASDAYFIFDPLEKTLALSDQALALRLEGRFGELRAVMSQPGGEAEAAALVAAMQADLTVAREAMAPRAAGAANAAFQAAFIIVREGFEVVLIVGALLTYAAKTGMISLRAPILWGGAGGVVASLVTAYALVRLFQASGAAAEVIEGATMLLAAAVLFFVSYWLISKAEAERWQRYIQGKVKSAIARGNLLALAGASFLAVYREGVETVLFYKALIASSPGQLPAIAGGFAGGAAALAVIYALYQRIGRRVPMRPFFLATGVLLYYLAVVFAGKGIAELQGGGVASTTPVAWVPRIEALGLYPTIETLAAQGLLLLCALVALVVALRRARRSSAAADLALDSASPGGAPL